MCCFTGPIIKVSTTSIFAREGEGNQQYLAYALQLNSANEVAMVLPLPVPADTPENAVRFIDLSDYSKLFNDLYDMMEFKSLTRGKGLVGGAVAAGVLAVQQVGSFEASFVPTIADFSRLDARFRLPADTWEHLPAYRSLGFAVFKLKAGDQKIHPMAFSFPRANTDSLFFPTVHIHDGKVHEHADFDHVLFAQVGDRGGTTDWFESPGYATGRIDLKRAAGIIADNQHLYCRMLKGKLPNQDTLLTLQ